ncbi:Phenylalanine--tRNA ligase beta subunit [Rubripirellula amarantea]|uniref:Phenylalanine--tRNA ligase beta subunit n=1 Tax=Rubripirellula amarantea TaxID=2527999 RepID=A0A5C5WY88_9BACT|nr:phenylalanine--tRNA ligase subunit beta [Rubripirellula amarantea]TWT55051.1 Phenylalanine--tRNA ligase beta subunit [Rubripirellula amarantea]
MLVSWKWLSQYVNIPVSHEELCDRLSLTGLNHEETIDINNDVVIDLEVTSNRGDCLGHLGVAREIGVLYDVPVAKPEPELATSDVAIDSLLSVENTFVEACPRYTARVIQGVKIGPSPDWLVDALQSVFWKRKFDGTIEPYQSVNNVVDATNFVMMECGQPLHAFDYAKIADQKIVVRPAEAGEKIEAIDHRSYELDPSMCVIADGKSASAIAGVMGGASSEVTQATTDLVIEAAMFSPLAVRRAARSLKLHSPSSFRFERKVDPVGVDWASRRVCQLIVEMAGGEVADGVIDTAPDIAKREQIVLRMSQLKRILGIQIDRLEVQRILLALGCSASKSASDTMVLTPPTWRFDLTREADLVEEVARIHGYEKIPEDSPIPVAPSTKRPFDTAMDRVRQVMTAGGLSEAMTPSVVTAKVDEGFCTWTDKPALETQTAMLKGSRRLRRSLIPSLIEGRAGNWASASIVADLFEIAHVYLPGDSADDLPSETYSLGIVSSSDFFEAKGLIETLCQRMGIAGTLDVESVTRQGFAAGSVVSLKIGETPLGYLGMVDAKYLKAWKLPEPVVAAELSLPTLLELSELVPQQQSVSAFPSIQRDLNFVVAESVQWKEMEDVVRAAVGSELAGVRYQETYRDAEKDGKDRKRVLMTVELQRHDATMSGDEADTLIQRVITACGDKLSAQLLG